MEIYIKHGHDPDWASYLDRVYALLGGSDNKMLFPSYFLMVVLPKIGGKLAILGPLDAPVAVGFLFPRKISVAPPSMGGAATTGPKLYTLRLYHVEGQPVVNSEEAWRLVNSALGEHARAVLYRMGTHNFHASAQALGTFDDRPLTIGRPSAEEAAAARAIHQQIWHSGQDSLYPVDIRSREFGLATNLVVRVGDDLAGFLMGFYKDGGSPLPSSWWEQLNGGWRIESQVMGVLPQYRGNHLGYLLKRAQGELATQEGIGIINWTVDPLQFPNAVLNFGKLGAVAFNFYPDLYPFRNALNRVPTSRFALTWLVSTSRVRSRPLQSIQSGILDVAKEEIPKINVGYRQVGNHPEDPRIAIEIPADWTTMQRENADEALLWRNALDDIFSQLIGIADGQYAVTGVGIDGDSCYLIAECSGDALWARLAA